MKKDDYYDYVSILVKSENILKSFCSAAYRAAKVGGTVAVYVTGINRLLRKCFWRCSSSFEQLQKSHPH